MNFAKTKFDWKKLKITPNEKYGFSEPKKSSPLKISHSFAFFAGLKIWSKNDLVKKQILFLCKRDTNYCVQ